jgi:hypothetical protein
MQQNGLATHNFSNAIGTNHNASEVHYSRTERSNDLFLLMGRQGGGVAAPQAHVCRTSQPCLALMFGSNSAKFAPILGDRCHGNWRLLPPIRRHVGFLFDSDAELSKACQRWTIELYFEINAKSVNFWP